MLIKLGKKQTKPIQIGTREKKSKPSPGRAFDLIVVFVEEDGWGSVRDGYSELRMFNASAPMISCQSCSW
jgi:hypothetical protein